MEIKIDHELAGEKALLLKLGPQSSLDQCLKKILVVSGRTFEWHDAVLIDLYVNRDTSREVRRVDLEDDVGHLSYLDPTKHDGCPDLEPFDRALEE
jgi:hypothetical protein